MRFRLGHPSYQALSEFAAGDGDDTRARIAAHIATCHGCYLAVQRLRDARAQWQSPGDQAPTDSLRMKVLASHDAGSVVMLPLHDAPPRRSLGVRAFAIAAAIVAAAVLGEGMLSSTRQADAGATTGEISIAPAMPRVGERVHVKYTAPPALAKFESLTLRGRLRTKNSRSYQTGAHVETLAHLTKESDGSYVADVQLPDSVVYVALAVENPAATIIDDRDKRTWEILTTLDGKQPSFIALYQRAEDMMGRSFEEGQASAERMVTLYPDSIAGWSYRMAFSGWLGVGTDDSILARHRAQLDRFEHRWRDAASVPSAILGYLAWYSRSIDTTRSNYWRSRLMREAPADGFALQWRMLAVEGTLSKSHDTTRALAAFDTLWLQRTPERAGMLATAGVFVATATGRKDLADAWWIRLRSVSPSPIDAEVMYADRLVRSPALARFALEHFHNVLLQIDAGATPRYLGETNAEWQMRVEQSRNLVLAHFGRALVATGNAREGLDSLRRATQRGWDVSLWRSLRAAAVAAHDTNTAWMAASRIASDPSLTPASRDSLDDEANRAIGDEQWSALVRESSKLFAEQYLREAQTRSLSPNATLRDSTGRRIALSELARDHRTVVIFWSRSCGWALDAVPSINDLATRLRAKGGRVVLIADGEVAPSAELSAVIRQKQLAVPVYFDVEHSTSKAFNNWGTPEYFVLDTQGRLRFAYADGAAGAFASAEALRLSEKE